MQIMVKQSKIRMSKSNLRSLTKNFKILKNFYIYKEKKEVSNAVHLMNRYLQKKKSVTENC